jgi:hypothetical protein
MPGLVHDFALPLVFSTIPSNFLRYSSTQSFAVIRKLCNIAQRRVTFNDLMVFSSKSAHSLMRLFDAVFTAFKADYVSIHV